MDNGLILSNVSKRFGGFWALRDIRATIPAGGITAFIGPNGAGKTTLFHVIAGTLAPDTGSIKYAGTEIVGMHPCTVAQRGIGRQFQDIRVFKALTVLENVVVAGLPQSTQWVCSGLFSRKSGAQTIREAKENALRWLDYVGLKDEQDLPAADLSYGQQKLLSIARLLARRSRVLLLDEPTAGLSQQMTMQVVDLIRRAATEHGITIALVEHNMSVVADLAMWIHFMHEGRVAFSGRSDHVLGNQSVREIYMGL